MPTPAEHEHFTIFEIQIVMKTNIYKPFSCGMNINRKNKIFRKENITSDIFINFKILTLISNERNRMKWKCYLRQ
jgi:hypothetical protein